MRPRRSAVVAQRLKQRLAPQNPFRDDVRSAAPFGDDALRERDRPAVRRDRVLSVTAEDGVDDNGIAAFIEESAAEQHAAIIGERGIHNDSPVLDGKQRTSRTSRRRIGGKRTVRDQQIAVPVEERAASAVIARPVEIQLATFHDGSTALKTHTPASADCRRVSSESAVPDPKVVLLTEQRASETFLGGVFFKNAPRQHGASPPRVHPSAVFFRLVPRHNAVRNNRRTSVIIDSPSSFI